MEDLLGLMTDEQLFEALKTNWQVLSVGIQEVLGDEPMPDPREMAAKIKELPFSAWQEALLDPPTRMMMLRNMDIVKLTADVQKENVSILAEMLRRGE